jgi:hypothetical protein
LKNIEETEAAKKLLQEKRLMVGRTKSDFSIPSSYSADYFQRGRDYAEKLRRGNIFLDSFIIDYICIFYLYTIAILCEILTHKMQELGHGLPSFFLTNMNLYN